MTLMHKAWIVVGLGAADLFGWMVTGSGWLDWLFGNNIVTKYGGWTLICIGSLMWRMGMLAKGARENIRLLPDERVVHTDVGPTGIVTVTDRRLLFHAGPQLERWRFVKGCPRTTAESWSFEDIEGVALLQTTDVFTGDVARHASAVVAALLPRAWTLWGVAVRFKNGAQVDIPCGVPLSVARHLDQMSRGPEAPG